MVSLVFSFIFFLYFSHFFFLSFTCYCCCFRLLVNFACVVSSLKYTTNLFLSSNNVLCVCCCFFFFGSAPKAYLNVQKGKEFFCCISGCMCILFDRKEARTVTVHCVCNLSMSMVAFIHKRTPIYECIQTLLDTNTHADVCGSQHSCYHGQICQSNSKFTARQFEF